MSDRKFKYYFIFIVIIIPLSLFSQVGESNNLKSDTINYYNADSFQQDSLYINKQLRYDRFYDSLTARASSNKITKTALNLLLVNKSCSGKFVGIEDLRNEEYFNLYSGKVIRNIEIVKLDVFGPTLKDTTTDATSWIYRAGNNTHVKTREFIIKNNLLFNNGDTINPLLLVDNERILRSLEYIKVASIQIAEIPGFTELVDVLIVTKDVYSAGFYVDLFNLESGVIELYENNIAGLGHELSGSLYLNAEENPTTGYKFNYNINNLGGSFLKTKIQYLNAFETKSFGLELNRSFFAYSTKWAGGLKLKRTSTSRDIVKTDTTLYNVKLNYATQDIWFGRSFLINTRNLKYQNRTKLVVSARYINNIFYKGPTVSERYNFLYHDNQLLLASIAFSRQKYFKSNLIYSYGKTEDIPIGSLIQFNTGLEKDEFYKRPYWGFRFAKGDYYPKVGYVNLNVELGGLYYNDQLDQGVFSITGQAISNLHAFNRQKTREFLSVNYTRGINRFSDEKLFLNYDDIGILSSDYLYGVQKLSFHSELVAFTNLYVYNFRFLVYGFGDLALIGPENKSVFENTLYAGIGIGIRVRNENLVFKTFQIKFAYYPVIPMDAEHFYLIISGENTQRPIDFEPTAPNIIEYN
ncbi:MAG: hypothetical protein PF485_10660 [Bacteroidales bacterium]|jgi:hypothetical protein|nr:hypothetical protein [Bacteroidales bacterium]